MVKFEGIIVPCITPFNQSGNVDLLGVRRLVNYLLDAGVHGLIPCATTGESVTMTEEEILTVIKIVLEETAGKVPVLAGTGTADTAKTVKLTKKVEQLGVDGFLVVSPYYNRPSQQGIFEHFKAVSSATDLPIILYNQPFRTGVNINVETVSRLAKIKNIVGIKESAGDINQLMDLTEIEDFSLLTGEDHMLFNTLCLGGQGGIMASANVAAEKFVRLYNLFKENKIDEARKLHNELLPLVRALFYEPNPCAIKAAMNMMGLPGGTVRLPIIEATTQCQKVVSDALLGLGLIK